MVYRYRTNLKKVFLTDSELHHLNERIAKSKLSKFFSLCQKSDAESQYVIYHY